MLTELNVNSAIIVYCAAGYGEEIYLKLISMGYRVICFCDNAEKNRGIHLLGLPVYNYEECRQRYPDAVYMVANSTYATALEIGMGLEQDGYVKNVTYYLSLELEMQGLMPEEQEGIQSVLLGKKLILVGEPFLCSVFKNWVHIVVKDVEVYFCPTEEEIDCYKNRYSDAVWIPLERGISIAASQINTELVQILQKHDVGSFSRYFLSHIDYCREIGLAHKSEDNVKADIQVKKVVFLKSSSFSGSMLIDSILDSHPDILYLSLSNWGINVWYIIKNVMDLQEGIPEAIISQIKGHEDNISGWIEDYKEILEEYIQPGKNYSERELFLIIHLAYYRLIHGSPARGKKIVYMDLHWNIVMRDSVFSWVHEMGFEIVMLEMVRNPYKRLGSGIKYTIGRNHGKISAGTFFNLLYECSGEVIDKEEQNYPVIRIRFEDLKLYPKLVLGRLCKVLGISWSDTLLETTLGGKESTYISNGDRVTGFDLRPVYYSYDEYFDAFDKFRLDLLFREKNRAYGYSFVDRDKYPMELKCLGTLFAFPFCIENYIEFKGEADRKLFRRKLELLCTQILLLEEEKGKYAWHFQFGDYLKVEKE